MNFRKNSAITLIALVITIIVLLILAGVSLNLVAGGDGILAKAIKAVDETNKAKIAEEIELAMAELKAEYYEARYVNKTTNKTFGEYAKEKLSEKDASGNAIGIATSNGKIILEDGKINFTETGKTEPTATGTFNETTGAITEIKATGSEKTEGGNQTPDGSGEDEVIPETTKYTVSYDANGGTGSVPASAEYEKDASVTVEFDAVPTKEGYKFLGWAETAEATTATYKADGATTFSASSDVTLYAVWKEKNTQPFASQIDTDNYGEYVNLGTSYVKGNELGTDENKETATEDWRIFHKDSNGVYLILADYLPYSEEANLGTGLLNDGSSYPYDWHSDTDRTDLITRLNDTTTWSKLLSPTYTAKGIEVTGAIDLEKWVASWNAKGYTNLKTAKKTGMSDGLEGYYIGIAENPTTLYQDVSSDTAGYGNTLYFPHQVDVSNSYGYWLASPSANGADGVMRVNYAGYVDRAGYDYNYYGVRPAVFLPSDIQAEKVDGVWELDI